MITDNKEITTTIMITITITITTIMRTGGSEYNNNQDPYPEEQQL